MTESNLLIFQAADGSIKLDVRLEDETVWLSQQQIADLFGKARSTINEHIKNVFAEGELIEHAVVRKFGISEFSTKPTNFYNLDVIISVGYRVKSIQGTRFRIWATQQLKEYIAKGYLLNDERFKAADSNSMQYFQQLQDRIREIRLSERFFYQKIKDIFTTSIDYDPRSAVTTAFFAQVQNKLLWAISQQTAAELVYRRSDASQPLMGMLAFDKEGITPTKQDASIAKNYLKEDEIKLLGLLVEQYLAFAEVMAQQQMPMTMQDWVVRLDAIIQINGRELLTHAGKISQEIAQEKMALEYQKLRETIKTQQHQNSLLELEQDLLTLAAQQNKKE